MHGDKGIIKPNSVDKEHEICERIRNLQKNTKSIKEYEIYKRIRNIQKV